MAEKSYLGGCLGKIIRSERRVRGLTQSQLASRAGCHPVSISKIERGIQSDVGVLTLKSLSGALNVEGEGHCRLDALSVIGRALELEEKVESHVRRGLVPFDVMRKGKMNEIIEWVMLASAAALSVEGVDT